MTQSASLAITLMLCLIGVAFAGPEMTVRWEVKLEKAGAVPCLYPNERQPDSVVVTDGNAVVRLDARGREVFRFDMGGQASAVPAVADLDGDGSADIVAGTGDGDVFALAGDGRVLWRHSLGAMFRDFKCVVLADLTGEGRPQVLLADDDGWVNCLDAGGRVRWRFKIDPYRASPPAVGDLDGDGSAEVVYGTDNGRVVCISADGRLRWQFRVKRNFGRSLPMIADLGGGPVVLITSSSPPFGSQLYCIEGASGCLMWAGNINQQGYAALAVADIDGDGRLEVITADKSNTVFAFAADGKPLWARHVGGHGIFFSPAIADVDGDGEMEIAVGVRASRQDGRNLFLLTPKGEVKGEYSLPGSQNTSPAVADLDGDGVIETVTCATPPGQVRCFTFGGRVRAGAIQSGCFRGASNMAACRIAAGRMKPPRARPSAPGALVTSPKAFQVGTNKVRLALPDEMPQQALIEVSRAWQKTRETRVFDLSEVGDVALSLMPGDQRVDIALIDGSSGRRLVTEARKVSAGSSADAAKVQGLDIAGMRRVIEEADDKHERARRRAALNNFRSALRDAGWNGSFAAWQDKNPWDNVEPLAEIPATAQANPIVEVWALGNEHEHAAVNVVALNDRTVGVRAKMEGLAGHVELLKPVWLPTKFGGRVPDMLPGFRSAAVFDVIPGEPCQLWLHFDTKRLKPGVHEGTLTLTSLEAAPCTLAIGVRLEVSDVALPDLPRTRVCTWRHVSPDGTGGLDDRVWADLKEHGVTVVYGPSPPAQKCDEKGGLVGEPDWSRFDGPTRRLVDEGAFLFYPGFGLSGPVKEFTPEWTRAMQAAAIRFDAHMRSLGIGNDRWAYYPVDEPCLTGEESVERFIRYARIIKEAAPNILIYADPAGAVTTEFLQRMSPYCDVWCPELSVLKQGPAEWLEMMRKNGVQVWCYEAPGDVRWLKPLGFYRMQPWVAARYGLDGSGYWVYAYDDLWGVGPDEPSFGAVQIEPDNTLTTTRRWEASRDGIEDSTLLHLLSDAIEAAEARGRDVSAARKLRQEALDAIAARQDAVDAITRWLIDHEMDFEAVQRYRRMIAEAIVALR